MSRRRSIPVGISHATPEAWEDYFKKLGEARDKKAAKLRVLADLLMSISWDTTSDSKQILSLNKTLGTYLIAQGLAEAEGDQHFKWTPRGKALASQVRQITTILFDLGGLKS